ncbi:hypothetical protein RJ641_030886 [Dillenia turbinata]|uniref:Uncharacterized protein n=1 Tax=Dillenia turbinata TaxID=194707 RepID=A0AAN8W003_9MAGN
MSPKTLDPSHSHSRHAIDSCTFQLHSWRPFHLPTSQTPKKPSFDSTTIDTTASSFNPKPYSSTNTKNPIHPKRPCFADRATSSFLIDSLDMSKLNLIDDSDHRHPTRLRWIARKRRRRGSRSVSGRSSDRSGTLRCCSVGASAAANGTCSDFPVAADRTDSSGELFVSGDGNWGSDEGKSCLRRESGVGGEREILGSGCALNGGLESQVQGNESGYGSEPGYRGDAEFGYDDEFDEEEDDSKMLFWGGDRFGDTNMEMVGENTFSEQKAHHRCRRKKHDWRMVSSLR